MGEDMNRRKFFQSIVRSGLLLGLIGTCATLLGRVIADPDCAYAALPCRGCPIASECAVARTQDKTR